MRMGGRWWSRLSVKVTAVITLATTIGGSVFLWLVLRQQRQLLMDQTVRNAAFLSDTLLSSLERHMLRNERTELVAAMTAASVMCCYAKGPDVLGPPPALRPTEATGPLVRGWLLLSPPPGCLGLQTTFHVTLSRNLGTLTLGWVAFPYGPQAYPRGPHSQRLQRSRVRSSTRIRPLSRPKTLIGALPHDLSRLRSSCD